MIDIEEQGVGIKHRGRRRGEKLVFTFGQVIMPLMIT